MGASGRFPDGLCKELKIHKMGAGAGGEKASVLHQLHAPDVDLPVALHRIFDGVPGLCEGRWVQDNYIVLLPVLHQGREQVKHVRLPELHPV